MFPVVYILHNFIYTMRIKNVSIIYIACNFQVLINYVLISKSLKYKCINVGTLMHKYCDLRISHKNGFSGISPSISPG